MSGYYGGMANINHDTTELTEQQTNILTGLALGDGCLVGGGINAYLTVGRAIADQEYLEYHFKVFGNLLTPEVLAKGVSHRTYSSSYYEEPRDFVNFHTRAMPCITPHYKRWYPDGKKIVPNDLKLTSETVATWFCDDGSISTWKLPYRFLIELSTHGFTKDEVGFLIELLEDRYNESFRFKQCNVNGHTMWAIRAYDAACRPMIEDMDKTFPQGMKRKRLWDDPTTRFYVDPPEKQISRIDRDEHAKKILPTFLGSGDVFTIKEIAAATGFTTSKTVSYSTVYKYIQTYLDNGMLVKKSLPFKDNMTVIVVTEAGRKFFRGDK